MDELLLRLQDVIVKENSSYKHLVDLAKEKRDVLLNRDIERLLVIISSEESLIDKIQGFEDVRLDIIDDLAEVWRVPKDELNFKKVISLSSVDFSSIYSEFLSTLQELKELNGINNQLIRDSLSFIDYILNVIAPSQEDFTYGKKKGRNARPLVVDREA